MKISRGWATPVTIGAFVVLAVTGGLMFFHLDRGLNKLAHEWLGWLLVAGVAAHVTVNGAAFRRHLQQPLGRAIVGVLVLLTVLSFWQPGGVPKVSPARRAGQALLAAPLDVVAPVARLEAAALRARLVRQGFTVPDGQPTLAEVARASGRDPLQALGAALAPDTP